jgi:hypothetical protein
LFTGMNVKMDHDSLSNLLRIQSSHSKQINMEPYFVDLDNHTLTLTEFETFLSRSIALETNRVFGILDESQMEIYLRNIHIVRTFVSGLIGQSSDSMKLLITSPMAFINTSRIIRSVPKHCRMLLFVPQLVLINNFSSMLADTQGDTNIDISYFLRSSSRFFVLINNSKLTFVTRRDDPTCNALNLAFGPRGFQCPGNIFTVSFLKSILELLKTYDITVDGTPIYNNSRFKHLTNKSQIKVTFAKK